MGIVVTRGTGNLPAKLGLLALFLGPRKRRHETDTRQTQRLLWTPLPHVGTHNK